MNFNPPKAPIYTIGARMALCEAALCYAALCEAAMV
jgi:hypothetical protein